MASWLFASHEARWRLCVDQFATAGMDLPAWPASLVQPLLKGLRAERQGCFLTAGWAGQRSWSGRMEHWLQEPGIPRAWMGMYRQDGEALVEAVWVTPRIGLFMRHRQGAGLKRSQAGEKVRAAYHCAGQLMCRAERLDACQRWPVGLRLMLVDDDLDLARWGWLQSGGQPVADPRSDIRVMRASNAACTEVLAVLEKLADPTTDTLVS